MKKDVYTIENDFTNDLELFDKVLHKQVIYRDGRIYQSFILEWENYRILDSRDFIKNIQKDKGIMSMLSSAQPFACYGFTSNKLAITFKKDLKFSKTRALAMLKNIIKVGNTRNKVEN
ncbi:hypothetical protein EG346_16970 [Chryseobacterium carnipullorum]|uniref:Uncharacterized protein n=2 Tax=Chryseobacterium carnipullorum TaxID=1124835 RepID=A0A3G6M4H6_CHRCU|nr:hypothetical protein [Chryseobacterium carnipullorum]AZA49767.1 hypothetical protein EG346_16970 [Chryseobacterium carnipullorum]AZA64659.1 hypothetical protein EG345_08000 [Chryseobacterium carnipullorum]